MQTQKSPEFHIELSALSIGANVKVSTYTSCIVNGVRYVVLSRDANRTTQNSGVLVEGLNQEKYYGQLEEIIELHYPFNLSSVLFRCKWFDPEWVTCENNITSIDTRHEWDKEDQLIFASQAKQVFYIREPCRANPNNNHRWVVENVNHRQIWDLPTNDGRVDNVVNDSIENVDVISPAENIDTVQNNCSSNCRIVIDLSQYFIGLPTVGESSVTPESQIPVRQSTRIINEVSEDETDYDGSDFDCETYEDDTEMSEGEKE